MNREELERYLRQYSPREEEFLREQSRETAARRKQQIQQMHRKLDTGAYLYESGQFMRSGEKIGVYRHDRFWKVEPHIHDYIELCYVWSGECRQNIEGRDVLTVEGDVCIFDTRAVHSVEAAGENDIMINLLMRREFFDSAFLSRMLRQGIVSEFLAGAVTRSRQNKHYLYFPAHRNSRIHDIMEQILMEYYTADLGMEQVLESYVIILFTELLRTLRDDSRESSGVSGEVQIIELLAYIEDHYEDCTLSEMGKAFGLHGNYLTALLKERTGRSFVEHVQEQRLKKARALLENTDLSVAELIPLCGYSNMNFFYKKFRESFGCTPAEYRKRFRNSVP